MAVEIHPQELSFLRPLTRDVTEVLRIKNTNDTALAFKVKTTAPKQYCVRPNSGKIEPGEHIEISILLQAMKQEPPTDVKCRDKFLVQSVLLNADTNFADITDIWKHVDNAERSLVKEKKIRVLFLSDKTDNATVTTPTRNGHRVSIDGHQDDSSFPMSPPDKSFVSPNGHNQSAQFSRSIGNRSIGNNAGAEDHSAPSGIEENISAAAAAVADAVPTSVEELKEQLAQAKATIASYIQGGSGLRQRKTNAAGDLKGGVTTQLSVGQQNSAGVPVPIVAALCLMSFLLAYLLF